MILIQNSLSNCTYPDAMNIVKNCFYGVNAVVRNVYFTQVNFYALLSNLFLKFVQLEGTALSSSSSIDTFVEQFQTFHLVLE